MLDQLTDNLHSPCVGICNLDDEQGLCEGCARTTDEIEAWPDMDQAAQLDLWSQLPERRQHTEFGNTMLPLSKRRLAEVFCMALEDRTATFTAGTYGAVAEFSLGADEPFEKFQLKQGLGVETKRGAIGFRPLTSFKGFAFHRTDEESGESQLDHIVLGVHAKLGCTSRKCGVTEIGPDHGALLDDGAEQTLFDLGVGAYHVDFCIRTSDPDLLSTLRNNLGNSVLDKENGLAEAIKQTQPDRVAVTQLARIEVRQPIPEEGGDTPLGPHTHLSAELLSTGLRHAPAFALPKTYFPGLVLYPGRGFHLP